MIRLFIIPFFLSLAIAQANTKKSNSLPNLSIELLDQGPTQYPLRSQRLWTLENKGYATELKQLDELSQDLLYLNIIKKENAQPSLNDSAPPVQVKTTLHRNKKNKTLVFFDLNFAPAEIKAAQEAAETRGENFVVIPERTLEQQQNIEREYRLIIRLQDEALNCDPDTNSKCTELQNKMQEARSRLDNWISQIKPVKVSEVFEKLYREGIIPSVYVFSGHSGGTGEFMGFFGWVNSSDIQQEAAKYPSLFENVSSILLWGCYTGTLSSLTDYWQKKFKGIKAYIGYRNRAPLGIRPSSGRLLKSYLTNENALLSVNSINRAHQVFKKLDLVADLDATAVIEDFFLSYDKAEKVSELYKRCEQFDARLLETYTCYDQGLKGCENPPSNHTGPLRTLYSYLQVNRHCFEKLSQKYPTLPTPESLIRLIYFDNIKTNFINHHSHAFPIFNEYIDALNLTEKMKIEAFQVKTRADIIEKTSAGDANIEKIGFKDGSYLNRSDWNTIIRLENSHANLKNTLGIGYNMCVPFSWVEPDAKDKDSCGFENLLKNPLSESEQLQLRMVYYEDTLIHWVKNTFYSDAVYLMYIFPSKITNHGIKTAYTDALKEEIQFLDKKLLRSNIEEQRLSFYKQLYSEVINLTDIQVRDLAMDNYTMLINKIDLLILEANKDPFGKRASDLLAAWRKICANDYERLKEL